MLTIKIISTPLAITALLFSVPACSDTSTSTASTPASAQNHQKTEQNTAKKPAFTPQTIATFDEPWAMTALPNRNDAPSKLLVTQKTGELFVTDVSTGTNSTGAKTKVAGVPKVAYGGQGGLGDVIVAPDFMTTKTIYLSYAEASDDGR